jgi:dipeptidyl aminopeptidase/acylaminoacyl peptidase
VFDWNREGVDDLYEKASDGTGEERLVLHTDQAKYPYCWSPDGRILVFGSLGPETGQDIWTLPMTSDRTPTALVHTRASESAAQLSPDGRWLAYVSDESGRPEVYVQAFPSAEKRWAVSANTGFAPQWRPDGREIFYVSQRNELMAADVGQGRGGFESGTPRPLFRVPVYLLNWRGLPVYAAAPDGQRFLVSVVPDHSASGPIVVTLNWAAQLTAPH